MAISPYAKKDDMENSKNSEQSTVTPTKAEAVHSDTLARVIYSRLFIKHESFGAIKTIKMHRNMSDNEVLKNSANKILRQRGNVDVALLICFMLAIAIGFTGCGGSTGWRVSFGVAPVKEINDQQGLSDAKKPVLRNAGGAIYKPN